MVTVCIGHNLSMAPVRFLHQMESACLY